MSRGVIRPNGRKKRIRYIILTIVSLVIIVALGLFLLPFFSIVSY
jgi:flagellar basal body-associated protein FliL